MGLSPLTRQAGQATQQSQQPKPATTGFRPIILNSAQRFPRPGDKVDASGVIFTGHTGYLDDLDHIMQCRGEYCLRNTLHNGIAGLTDDGRLIFGVNSRFGGRYATVMGAFDPAGKPVAPTVKEQRLLGNLLPNSENRLVLGTKSGNEIGFKTNGTNPSGGVYVGNKTITFDLGFLYSIDNDNSIAVDASATTDWEGREVLKRSLGIKAQGKDMSVRGGIERAGQTTTHTLDANMGRYFVSGQYATDGVTRNRQLNAGIRFNESVTLTASYKPDNRPPSMAPQQPYRFNPDKPDPLPDYSNASVTLSVKF